MVRLIFEYQTYHYAFLSEKTEVLSEFERGALKIKLLGHQDRYRAREKREEPGIDWPAVEAEGRSLGTLIRNILSDHYLYFS